MANATKTVKSSGGDYTSLNAALAGLSGNLTTNCAGTGGAGILTIECYNLGAETADTTAAATGTGYTTSADYYLKIIGAASEKTSSNSGKWSTSRYRLAVTSNADSLVLRLNDVVVDDLQVSSGYEGNLRAIVLVGLAAGTSAATITNCIVRCDYDENEGIEITNYMDAVNIENCIVYKPSSVGQSGGDEGIVISMDATVNILNCTVYNFNDGIEQDAGTVTVTNTAVFGCGDDFDFDGTMTISYCASDDGDGTNAVNISPGGTEATDWAAAFVDYANGDFHVKNTSSVLYNAATDLSGTFTDDIDGDTRSQWDIGADEYVAAATGSPRSNPFSRPFRGPFGRGGF